MTKLNWKKTRRSLQKEIVLKDFQAAVELINRIAKVADKIDHHPDLNLYDYNHLKITITTHQQNSLTEKDHQLAELIEELI